MAEKAEEIRIGPQQQASVALLQSLLVGLHRAIEREEIRVPTIGVGEDAIALGIALAADALSRRRRLSQQNGYVAIGLGFDLLRAPRALGTELRGFLLPLGLHARIDGLAVLFRQVRATDAYVDDVDAESLGFTFQLAAHFRHQLFALVAHDLHQRDLAEHASQRRIQQGEKPGIAALDRA